MRDFTLYNLDKTKSFNLNENGIIATNPKGLGNSFALSYTENEKNRFLTNMKPNFENITFDIYFNAHGKNGYANYKKLSNFLNLNGKNQVLLEYDDGITKKLCRVILKSLPKSEITEDGILMETLTFERQTYWYMEEKATFTLSSILDDAQGGFPLSFPLGFAGEAFRKEAKFTNEFLEEVPVEVKITGAIEDKIELYVINSDNEIISQIKLLTNCKQGRTIIISSINNKKVTVIEDGVSRNGYDLIDKSAQSFLYLPQGTYRIRGNIKSTDKGSIEISVLNYLLD